MTPCPLSTNSLEPSPKLVPSEVQASGHHGFVKWGYDAKITKNWRHSHAWPARPEKGQ